MRKNTANQVQTMLLILIRFHLENTLESEMFVAKLQLLIDDSLTVS